MKNVHAVHLTAREQQILHLIAAGLSAKEAAISLHIAPCTIERHIENVRLKTRTRNRAHMVAVVINEGWLEPDAYLLPNSHNASEISVAAPIKYLQENKYL